MKLTLAAGGLLSILALQAHADYTTFRLQGEILKNTCVLKTTKLEVDFGTIDRDTLRRAGTSKPVNFNIELDECDERISTTILMQFTGDAYPNHPDKLKLADSSTASGYAVGVYFDGQPIQLNQPATPLLTVSEKKSVTIPFTSQLEVMDSQQADVGHVAANMNFIVFYE